MDIDGLSDRPWVVLPGTLCTGAVFDPFLDVLGVATNNRHVVAMDRPQVTDYWGDFQDVTPDTVVCGFSLGAIVAAHAAHRMTPHAMIFFGLNPFADDVDKAPQRHALSQDVQRLGGGAALRAREPAFYGDNPNQTRDRVFEMADQTAHLIAPQTRLALSRPGALTALAQSSAPVLCLTGSNDAAAPCFQGQAAASNAPNGQFCKLNGLGHFALLEDPHLAVKAVQTQVRGETTTIATS